MLAVPSTVADAPRDWAVEFKWDGVRAVVTVDEGEVRAWSRRGHEVSATYPELRGLAAVVPDRTWLDGEIVAFDRSGRPSFATLQGRMNLRQPGRVAAAMRTTPVAYVAFDLLRLDGRELLQEPYRERRRALEGLGLADRRWQVPPAGDDLDRMLGVAGDHGLEGVVVKRPDSVYQPGRRSPDWRKVRLVNRQEFLVGGWRPGSGGRSQGFGSLLVGYHDRRGLRYAGAVGSGFSEQAVADIRQALDRLATEDSPFVDPVPHRDARFVRPMLVVDVQFGEWTPEGLLRQPSCKGVRVDKDPGQVVREPPV